MKRRDFLQKGTLVAGIAGAQSVIAPLFASDNKASTKTLAKAKTQAPPKELRSTEYLKRAKSEKLPAKLPAFRKTEATAGVSVSSMSLAERLKRKVVPRNGFCSLEPGKTVSDGITSGNGHMNIEVTCDPYAEQILFHHESLLIP
jgi:alpha-L-fucosidase 2